MSTPRYESWGIPPHAPKMFMVVDTHGQCYEGQPGKMIRDGNNELVKFEQPDLAELTAHALNERLDG